MRLSQVRVLARDPAASHRFYRDVLGLVPAYGAEDEPYSSFAAGDGSVAVFLRAGQQEVVSLRAPGDGALVVLEVDDLDATERRIVAAGGTPEGPITARLDWGIRMLHLRDPDGNLIEIVQSIPMEET